MNAPTAKAPSQVTPPLVELQPIGRQIPPPRSMVPGGHPPPPPPAWPPETLASALAVREAPPALPVRVDGALLAVADVADLAVLALRVVPGERRRVVLRQAHFRVGDRLDQLVRGNRGGVVEPAARRAAAELAAVAGHVGDHAVV